MSSEFPELSNTMGLSDPSAQFPPSDPLPEAMGEPSEPRVDGRNPDGTFGQGNHFGVGSPLAGKVARLRAELFACCTPEEMREGVKALLAKFRRGDVAAAKLVLQYTLGQPESLDLLAVVARMEQVVFRGVESHG